MAHNQRLQLPQAASVNVAGFSRRQLRRISVMPTMLLKTQGVSGMVNRVASYLTCLGLSLLLFGCGGSWKSVNPDLADEHQDRLVEAIVTTDGRNLEFDGGSVTDSHRGGRFEGDILRGYVEGKQVEIELTQIRQVRFADEGSKSSEYVVVGVLFAAAVGLFVALFFYFEGYEG